MEQLILPASSATAELARWLQQAQGQPVLAAIGTDGKGQIVVQPIPDVDAELVQRVLKSIAQYEEVLRRLA